VFIADCGSRWVAVPRPMSSPGTPVDGPICLVPRNATSKSYNAEYSANRSPRERLERPLKAKSVQLVTHVHQAGQAAISLDIQIALTQCIHIPASLFTMWKST